MVNHLSARVTRTGVTHVDVFDGDEEGADNLTCAFCQTPLGYSSGDGEIPSSWRDYWAVGAAGDEGATVFCEDDISWLYDVAHALQRDLGAAALTTNPEETTHS